MCAKYRKGVSMPCLMTDGDRKHFRTAHAFEMCGGKFG